MEQVLSWFSLMHWKVNELRLERRRKGLQSESSSRGQRQTEGASSKSHLPVDRLQFLWRQFDDPSIIGDQPLDFPFHVRGLAIGARCHAVRLEFAQNSEEIDISVYLLLGISRQLPTTPALLVASP